MVLTEIMQLRLILEFREDLPERSWELYSKVVFAESCKDAAFRVEMVVARHPPSTRREAPLKCPQNVGPWICEVFLNRRMTNMKMKCFSEEQMAGNLREAEQRIEAAAVQHRVSE